MHALPVILDARPAYLGGAAASFSLLQAPLGDGTYLERLLSVFRSVSGGKPILVSPLAATPGYADAVRSAAGCEVIVASAAEFASHLAHCELSDWILLWDSLCAPAEDLDVEPTCRTADETHWIHRWLELESSPDGAREYVEVNPGGMVQRIRRLYDGVTWVRVRHTAGLLATVASLRQACTGGSGLESLGHLHLRLVEQGTPSRDVPLKRKITDLRLENGLLALVHERVSSSGAQGDSHAAGCAMIHPSARIIGPAHIQRGASIGARATIVGPTLVGSGAHIGDGAFVAHSVLTSGSAVQPGERVMRRVVCAPGNGRVAEAHKLSHQRPRDKPRAQRSIPSADATVRRRNLYLRAKRWTEAALALIGLLVLSPLMSLVALIIVLDSRGSVFFGHEREGLGSKRFRCWKFRTMIANAHLQQRALYTQNAVDGPQFKLPRDPRVTRVGEFLRKSNLDELPQLINVVLGEMSLIGPRPSPFRENQICVPWRRARLSVRPGITGLWQICRQDRDAGDFHQWIRFDSLYVKHVGVWLDVRIMIATILSLGGRWSVPLEWIIADRQIEGSRFERSSRPGFIALPIEQTEHAGIGQRAGEPAADAAGPGA